MGPGSAGSSGALGRKDRYGDRSSWAPPEPSWVMAFAHAAGPGCGRPVSGSTDPPETWSPGRAGPPPGPGLQASSSTFPRPTRPFLQPHLGRAPASFCVHTQQRPGPKAGPRSRRAQSGLHAGWCRVPACRPPAAQHCPPSPGEGRCQSTRKTAQGGALSLPPTFWKNLWLPSAVPAPFWAHSPGRGAGPRCPSPMGTTRTRHCLRSHHPRGWRGVPWGLVPRVTVGGPGAALTQPCPSLHHLPPGPPLGNAGDSLVLRLSCLSETPVSWNAQRVSWTVLDFLVVSSPTFVIILFCSLLSLLHCLCLSYLRLPLCYHTLISKNSLLLRCFVNTTSLPLSELA